MSFSYGRMVMPGKRDPVLQPYQPLRVSVGWVVGVLLLTLVVGDIVWRVLRIGGVGLPYGLTDGTILASLLGYRVVKALRGPPVPLPANPPAPTTEFADRPFSGARRWEDRLAWTHDDPISFNRTVRPQLVSLVDEQLRRAYGVSLDGGGPGGPQRVRALLGDPLWTLLSRPVDRVPRSRELAAAVTDMERLFQGGQG